MVLICRGHVGRVGTLPATIGSFAVPILGFLKEKLDLLNIGMN